MIPASWSIIVWMILASWAIFAWMIPASCAIFAWMIPASWAIFAWILVLDYLISRTHLFRKFVLTVPVHTAALGHPPNVVFFVGVGIVVVLTHSTPYPFWFVTATTLVSTSSTTQST